MGSWNDRLIAPSRPLRRCPLSPAL
jgi:hypothetical protein